MQKYIRLSPNEKVKVCMIKASAKGGFADYKRSMLGLPQNIFSLAACTPEWASIQMVDETVGVKVDWNTDADIIVVMFHTPDAIRGYEIADKFRTKGKTVVLGGLHTTFMQDEALEHADAILIGESEGIWEELLEDYLERQLKSKYERDTVLDLADLKPYPTDILPKEVYDHSWTVTVSRGCPNKCSYCTVHKFFPTYRKRPIEDVVDEIKNSPADFIELKADNLTIDREYSLALFKAIEPLNIIWMTCLEPEFAEDRELVEAAAKSGLRSILLGIETPSREVLKENNKAHLKLEKLKEQMDLLHQYDMEVDSAMLFGFESHTKDIFKETLEFAIEIDIDITHGVVPIPFPGTELYMNLEAQGKLKTKDWSKYDGSWLVYEHNQLTEIDIYKGAMWYEREFEKRHNKKEFQWHHRWDAGDYAFNTETNRFERKNTLINKNQAYSQAGYKKPIKWKTLMAIVMVLAGIILDFPIIFGLLYFIWSILDIKTGHAYIIEDIQRSEHPILFWTIVLIWMFSGLYILLSPFIIPLL